MCSTAVGPLAAVAVVVSVVAVAGVVAEAVSVAVLLREVSVVVRDCCGGQPCSGLRCPS